MEKTPNRTRLDTLRQSREDFKIAASALGLRSGINPNYISQVENGYPNPSDDFLAKYERALTELIAEQARG